MDWLINYLEWVITPLTLPHPYFELHPKILDQSMLRKLNQSTVSNLVGWKYDANLVVL
jgi:hypothetical protein